MHIFKSFILYLHIWSEYTFLKYHLGVLEWLSRVESFPLKYLASVKILFYIKYVSSQGHRKYILVLDFLKFSLSYLDLPVRNLLPCNEIPIVLKCQLSLQELWNSFMVLMNHCLTLFSEHAKEKQPLILGYFFTPNCVGHIRVILAGVIVEERSLSHHICFRT